MKQSRIGYNIHAQNIVDKDRLFSHLVTLNPAAVVVMDEPGVAREIKDRLPNCTVIFRWNGDGGDGSIYTRMMPKPWLAMMMDKLQGDRRIMLYTNNESGLPRRLIAWLTELIPLANEIGVSLCCLNTATGNPQPDDWEIAKPVLELLATNRQHVLGLHCYAGGVITSGLYGGYPDNAGVEPGKSGGMNLIPRDSWPNDVSNVTRYHMGRFKFLLDYLDREHIKHPRIVITEHGFDDTSDIKAYLETLRKTQPFQNIRGWRSLVNQWAAWWPQWSAERAYFEQIKWANETIYKGSPVEAQCIFCWGNSGGWEGFDIAGATEFQDLLAAYANEPDTVPEPTPPPFPFEAGHWLAVTLRINARDGAKNIRLGPGTQYPILREFVQELVTFIPYNTLDTKDQYEDGDGNKWIPIIIHDVQAWVSHKVVVEDLVNYQQTPPPPVPPLPAPDIISSAAVQQQIEAMSASITTLTKYREKVDERVTEIEHELAEISEELSAERHLSNALLDSIRLQELNLEWLNSLLDQIEKAA